MKIGDFLSFVDFKFGSEGIELFFHEDVFFDFVIEGFF